ncbi:hypothetical protein BDF19DRAFT_441790 [Syncephalis fuscata]|nr:hypothetical protein BDF19DRAFT_441790 [Syncephalis fuscata]
MRCASPPGTPRLTVATTKADDAGGDRTPKASARQHIGASPNGSIINSKGTISNHGVLSPSSSPSLPSSTLATSLLSNTSANTKQDDTLVSADGEQSAKKDEKPKFDYRKFLEQMRHRSSAPITRYLKSFLREFHKKAWTVNEQVRIIHDFLEFIENKMLECDQWRNSSEIELTMHVKAWKNLNDNGNLLILIYYIYNRIFCSSTTDDAERDEIIHQKIQIFRWIEERHLDIPISPHNASYFEFAQKELLKMNNYRAPRDKLICILNCCIVIFSLLRRMEGESAGADIFLPILIYVVIKANPEQLVSNVQYISRFRHPSRLESEAGYYLTNLLSVISFLERLDASLLSITKEEFDSHISRTLEEMAREKPDSFLQERQYSPSSSAPYRSIFRIKRS